MAGTEMIAIVRKAGAGWVAAVSFVGVGMAKLDVVTANSENAGRLWIIHQAENAGIAETDILFMPTDVCRML